MSLRDPELKVEWAKKRLDVRGALRAVKRVAKLNLSFTPGYMTGRPLDGK